MIEDPPSPEYQEQDAMLAAALSVCPKRDKPAVTIGFRQGWEAHKDYIANETIGPFDTAEQLISALDAGPEPYGWVAPHGTFTRDRKAMEQCQHIEWTAVYAEPPTAQRDIENAFAVLALCGVSRERAKTVANGIDVLATRCARQGNSLTVALQRIEELEKATAAEEEPAASAMMTIGAQIKIVRRRLGLTQEAFAREFNVPLGTLHRWERDANVSRAAEYVLQLAQNRLPKRAMR